MTDKLPDNNPKTSFGEAKPGISDVPPWIITLLGMAFRSGKRKYGRFNWRKKTVSSTVYYNAMWRHMQQWMEGGDADADSGLHPLAHVMACCAIIMDAEKHGNLNDDRLLAEDLPPPST